jgi:hypothetical protein
VCNETIDSDVYAEFSYNLQGEGNYGENLLRDINLLTYRYESAQLFIRVLQFRDDDRVRKFLSQFINIKPGDTLSIILSRSKRLLQEIENKKSEYARIAPVAEGKKPDRKYFNHLIIEVSKYVKFQIDKHKMLLCEFVELINDMREYAEQIEAKIKKTA